MAQHGARTSNWRVRTVVHALGVIGLCTITTACWPRTKPSDTADVTKAVPAEATVPAVNIVPVSPINFTVRSQNPDFQSAIGELSNDLGLRFSPMDNLPGAYQATASYSSVEENLLQWHQAALKHGAFLFRIDCNFGFSDRPDVVTVLPTTDKYEVLQAVGTDGVNFEVDNAAVIAWLRTMEEQNPFTLTGAGPDFVEGYFVSPPQNAPALAKRMYEFCPDIVDQGTGTVEALANEVAKGKLYLWWD